MGRHNTSYYDDLLLQKAKGIICQVLDNLNENEEIECVHALSSRETNDRFRHTDGMSSAEAKQEDRARRRVTFEQFVQELDGGEDFVKNLVEILVGETLRVAIQRSVVGQLLLKPEREQDDAFTLQTEVEWEKSCEQSHRLQTNIDNLTKANRRSTRWQEGSASSPSSSSSSESDLTITPYDVVTTLGTVPRAPPSVLPRNNGGRATTRITRSERIASMTDGAASRSRRSILMTERAQGIRMSRLRQAQLNEMRSARRNRVGDSHRSTRVSLADAISGQAEDGETSPSLSAVADDRTTNLIHRFLTQPFPAEARSGRSLSRRDVGAHSSAEANEIDLLNSIYGDDDEHASSPSHVHQTARLGEFEAFASSRRQHQRNRGDNNDTAAAEVPQTGEDARENETFMRALDTLFRADETIRQVSHDADVVSAGVEGQQASARRYELPAMNELRPVVRLPNRSQGRQGEGSE